LAPSYLDVTFDIKRLQPIIDGKTLFCVHEYLMITKNVVQKLKAPAVFNKWIDTGNEPLKFHSIGNGSSGGN
jgi:hypothetical protein